MKRLQLKKESLLHLNEESPLMEAVVGGVAPTTNTDVTACLISITVTGVGGVQCNITATSTPKGC